MATNRTLISNFIIEVLTIVLLMKCFILPKTNEEIIIRLFIVCCPNVTTFFIRDFLPCHPTYCPARANKITGDAVFQAENIRVPLKYQSPIFLIFIFQNKMLDLLKFVAHKGNKKIFQPPIIYVVVYKLYIISVD